MDEFELLIGILVGLFKLVSWIFKLVFRLLGGILGAGRRAFRPRVEERAAPPRLARAQSPRSAPRSPPPRSAPRSPPRAAPARAVAAFAPPSLVDDAYAPPPPPPPPRAGSAADLDADGGGDWLTPSLVRDALVLDTLLHRR